MAFGLQKHKEFNERVEFSNYMEEKKPHAISILSCSDDGKFSINVDALEQIFRQQEIQDMPISIDSISGEFRGGKSFMLNFFLRYLRNKGYEKSNWMGSEHQPLKEGFDWKGGRKACTNGIMIWSEIFYVTKNGKKTAIMLMDTQGLFDNKSDNKTNSIIFALSTLISSVQIFNLSKQIKQSDLGFLQFFTGYAKAASQSSLAKDAERFQTLYFLVRDWPFADEIAHGIVGGHKYLDEFLREKSPNEELATVKKYLDSSFSNIKCCLMPNPGRKVAEQANFKGCLKDIEKLFLDHTASFVESLFRPENMVVKTINGEEVYAFAILLFIKSCCEGLTAGNLPDPKTMLQTVAEVHNFQVQEKCAENYERIMVEAVGSDYVDDEQLLRDVHEQAKAICLKQFAERTKFGETSTRNEYHDYLLTKIMKAYDDLVQRNRTKKLETELEMRQAIQSISAVYIKEMEQKTQEKKFLETKKLEEEHKVCFDRARAAWEKIKVPDRLKIPYLKKLEKVITREFEKTKRQNNDKKEIVEAAQNKLKQMAIKLRSKTTDEYEEQLSKIVGNYVDESYLEKTGSDLAAKKLNDFKSELRGCQTDDTIVVEQAEILKANLNKALDDARNINIEKKETIEKEFQLQRNQTYEAYDKYFKNLLKNKYMKKENLAKTHAEVVKDLMEDVKSKLGNYKAEDAICAKHLQIAESTLEDKYSSTEKQNKKNNTILKKFTRALKFAGRIISSPFLYLIKKLP